MKNNKTVLSNTIILYAKMVLTVGISLYTTRIVLNALGVVDYGIFNLVAGVIAMLSFLNAAMSTSTQRYLSFYQGKQDASMQKNVFSNSILLHILIGVIVVLLLELAGLFLFNGVLNIPVERVETAKVIYHYMSLTVFFTILSTPFLASINAHEHMLWIAIVGILEVFLKLGVACLLFIVSTDRLIIYALGISTVSIISFLLYASYCLRKYPECSIKGSLDRLNLDTVKSLTSFAGWNLFGALCGVGRSQGIAIILNIFLGAIVNAAYGIANQVSGQLAFFSATIMTAINPQIMKSEGANERERMLLLSMTASKFAFFALACFSIPFIFEMPKILEIWLGSVPPYTVVFCQLMLICVLVNQLTIGLQSALQATGKIKLYQGIVGSLILLNLPIAYLLLMYDYPGFTVLISYIVIEVFACILRLYFAKRATGMSVRSYLRKVIAVTIIPVFAASLFCFLMISYVDSSDYRFIFTIAASAIVFVGIIYFTSLSQQELSLVNKIVGSLKNRIRG